MRRMLLTAMGATALALATPAAALANHRHHHHKHHARHARASFLHLGPAAAGAPPSSSSAPTPPPKPTTSTTTPTAEENAGTVKSYTGGVLTVTLGDGSTVAGKVTASTRFECVSTTAAQPQADTDDEPGPGDDNGPGDDQGEEDRNQQGGSPWSSGQQQGAHMDGHWQQGNDNENGPGGDQDEDAAPISSEPPCDSSALTEGAVVRAAELRIAPGGAEFEWIELVR